uniref:Uncharacterized protein n=1 Tax=Aegilops tauschii subsp. strangulata TaxID=200361 RepID=A0A453GF86_AEGTS
MPGPTRCVPLTMAEPLKANGNGAAEGGAAGSAFASVKVPPSPPRRLQRFDSLHMEAGKIPGGHSYAAKVCSSLALFLGSTDIFIFLQYISKGTASISIPVMMGTSSQSRLAGRRHCTWPSRA